MAFSIDTLTAVAGVPFESNYMALSNMKMKLFTVAMLQPIKSGRLRLSINKLEVVSG